MMGRSDSELLEKATSLQRCLFMHNRIKFEGLHHQSIEWEKKRSGIIIGAHCNVYKLAHHIATF
jgi:hypothetical protein